MQKPKITRNINIKLIFAASVCLLSFAFLCRALFLGYYPDFSGYYYGSQYFLDGINPYLGGGKLYTTYVYPPSVLLLFVPITLIPFNIAQVVWVFSSIVMLLISVLLCMRVFSIKAISLTGFVIFTLVFIAFPVKFTLGMGQINILILLLLVLFLFFIKKSRDSLGGMFLGVALVLKLFPLFLPLYLFFQYRKTTRTLDDSTYEWNWSYISFKKNRFWLNPKQTNKTISILIGIVTVLSVSIAMIYLLIPSGFYNHFLYDTLPSFVTSWKLDYYNQSLSGFVGRLFGTGVMGNIIKTVLSLLISIITILVTSKNIPGGFEIFSQKFGLLITASLLVNNFSWQHHFIWLIIPFFIIFVGLKKMKARWFMYYLLGLSYFLIASNMVDPFAYHILYRSHVFYGAVILWGIGVLLLTTKNVHDKK